MWSRFKTLDPFLLVLPIVLMTISTVVIYVLTVDTAGLSTAFRQGLFSFVSLILMVVFTFVDYRALRAWAPWIYTIGLGLLALVEIVGRNSFGAQRWIDLGIFQLQPGELMKFILIIGLAALFSRRLPTLTWKTFLQGAALLFIPAVLVLFQPDLGTSLVLVVIGTGIMLYSRLAKVQKVVLLIVLALGATAVMLSFMNVKPFTHLLKDYQKDRLASFIDPKRDPAKTGYNVIQSKIAVGSGGLTGRGLGFGSQSQLNFLPVAHADFIFAGIAEAWGIIGSYAVMAVYAFLIIRILSAARIAGDEFGMLICVGLACKLIFEVLVNIGMNMGIMPVTGIPLPFLSYGGTTLLTNALLLGVVQSVVVRYKRLTFER
jgi:rod shape determining protein RodA